MISRFVIGLKVLVVLVMDKKAMMGMMEIVRKMKVAITMVTHCVHLTGIYII